MKRNRERDLEIYRLRKDEGYTVTKLADMFQVKKSRICRICKEIEHERKRLNNSNFLIEMPLRMHVALRKKFGSESEATPESVAQTDPLELKKMGNTGDKTLKKTKEILKGYNIQHLMHKNWNHI